MTDDLIARLRSEAFEMQQDADDFPETSPAKSGLQASAKLVHQAADRIEMLETALTAINDAYSDATQTADYDAAWKLVEQALGAEQ